MRGENNIGYAKRKISQYELDGTFIKTFNSIKEAAKQFGGRQIHSTVIQQTQIKGKKNTAYGFVWKYEDNTSIY